MLQSTLLFFLGAGFAALTESAALPADYEASPAPLPSTTSCSSAIPTTTDTLGLAFPTTAIQPTLVPLVPIVPTNPSELPLPSSVALILVTPSDLPTAIPITASYSVIQPSEILSLPTAIPITASYSVINPTTLLPASTSISIAFPVYPPQSSTTLTATGRPRASPRPRPHKSAGGPKHGYGAGWWPTGVPRPTGGFGYATARPSGGFPGAGLNKSKTAGPAKATPCTLEKKVKPTPTGA